MFIVNTQYLKTLGNVVGKHLLVSHYESWQFELTMLSASGNWICFQNVSGLPAPAYSRAQSRTAAYSRGQSRTVSHSRVQSRTLVYSRVQLTNKRHLINFAYVIFMMSRNWFPWTPKNLYLVIAISFSASLLLSFLMMIIYIFSACFIVVVVLMSPFESYFHILFAKSSRFTQYPLQVSHQF